jgi:hypothetical protein
VVSLPAKGRPRVVRHASREPCDDVRVRAVGSRAAVMLELADHRVRFALLGQGAKVIERPHAVFSRAAGRLGSPEVVWTDDHWTAMAHQRDEDALWVEPIGQKGASFTLPRCAGAFAARFFHKRFYALEVEPRGERAELRLWRSEPDGGSPQQRTLEVGLTRADERRLSRDIRHTLKDLSHRATTRGDYRTQIVRPALERDGATLRLHDEGGVLTVSARPGEEGTLSLRVALGTGDVSEIEDAPSSLVRLARWVRLRWSEHERAADEARVAWANMLAEALGGRVSRFDAAGATFVLGVVLPALPDPETLDRWLRRVREEARGEARSIVDPR